VGTGDIRDVSQTNLSVPASVRPLSPTENCKCCTIVLREVIHRLYQGDPYFQNVRWFHGILENVILSI